MASPTPASVLIVGAGVFGLSTALALSNRKSYSDTRITILEASPTIPNPVGSSVDTSRIVRADYAHRPYANLASQAQKLWRETEWGADGRYSESGLVLVANKEKDEYVKSSLDNVRRLAQAQGEEGKILKLDNKDDIKKAMGEGCGAFGDWGYVNAGSGWADAEASVQYAKELVSKTGRVQFRTGRAKKLLKETSGTRQSVAGVELEDGRSIFADLVVLATGAWTGELVDLRGRAEATGHCLAYIELTEEEQELYGKKPIALSFSTGMFIIPPRNRLLKIARHAYGYRNPINVSTPGDDGTSMEVSMPRTDTPIPIQGEQECRRALRETMPPFGDRPFVKTRICWYTDTPDGDFLVDYHPSYSGLFLATGGSGHAFKFFPIIGEKVADAMQGKLERDLKDLWAWPEQARPGFAGTEDGSRSGQQGLVLEEELRKGLSSKL